MTRYAENTAISAEASRGEIERTLLRYGAAAFSYGWEGNKALVAFKMRGKFIRFVLEMPDREDQQFKLTETKRWARSEEAAYKAWEQACRQKWRALALVVKAKLEAVESGITSFEEEFLAAIMLPNNQTVGQYVLPQVTIAYESGKMPALIPGVGKTGK